jgi:hypothetical protein
MSESKLKTALVLALFCVASISTLAGSPQVQVITIEKPFQSRSLSGTVSDPSGAGRLGVLVQECDDSWKNCFAQTQTDYNGHFSLKHAKKGKHYLRLSLDGFDPTQITVIVDKSSKAEIGFELHIST